MTEHEWRIEMPKSIYEDIYKDLKMKIEDNTFAYQELLPSENTLIQTYGCSRNTLRRAVSLLVSDGYVQTMQGKGVRNIYRPNEKTAFTIGEIETFKESVQGTVRMPIRRWLFLQSFVSAKISQLTQNFPLVQKYIIFSVSIILKISR